MAAREKIFVSYRRTDSEAEAGRIAERLTALFGATTVFFDTASIGIGEVFPDRIANELDRALVVLVVMGKGWLPAADQYGRRRIDDPEDWVRVELQRALAAPGLEVVPILIDGVAEVPPSKALPSDLASLSQRNAWQVRSRTFGTDMRILVDWLVSRNLLPNQRKAATASESSPLPTTSVNWHVLGSRYDREQRKTSRIWAFVAVALVIVATSLGAGIALSGASLAPTLPFPALLVLAALTSIPKILSAREKLIRSGNLLIALNEARDVGDYKRLEARAMEMYA